MTAACREGDIQQALLAWIRKVNPNAVEVDVTTPLLASRVLTSLQITDLLLMIERLRGEAVEADELRPHVFRNVETICSTFFQDRFPVEVEDVA